MHHLKNPAFKCWTKRAFAAFTSLKAQPFSNPQLRFQATQANCTHMQPKCGTTFKHGPCVAEQVINIKQKQPAPSALPTQERSIRIRRSFLCCGSPCPDALPRFDLLYYRRTNKFNCDYQQTWDECPELVRKPKVVCCFDKVKPAIFKKRPRHIRPTTACKQACAATQASCPYVTLKGCRLARRPPRCTRIRRLADCTKRPAPYPAYSECTRNKLPRRRPVECRCLLTPSICEVWAYHHHMAKVKKI